jgi:hypothetical protein
MPKKTYQITVYHQIQETYVVEAKSSSKAVTMASKRAIEEGLHVVGSLRVEDINGCAVDMFEGA